MSLFSAAICNEPVSSFRPVGVRGPQAALLGKVPGAAKGSPQGRSAGGKQEETAEVGVRGAVFPNEVRGQLVLAQSRGCWTTSQRSWVLWSVSPLQSNSFKSKFIKTQLF